MCSKTKKSVSFSRMTSLSFTTLLWLNFFSDYRPSKTIE